jgi:hypothetical protein
MLAGVLPQRASTVDIALTAHCVVTLQSRVCALLTGKMSQRSVESMKPVLRAWIETAGIWLRMPSLPWETLPVCWAPD